MSTLNLTQVLRDGELLNENGELGSSSRYCFWMPNSNQITLDDAFTADELEAMAWWMRTNKAS